jgi:hypothetical protein
LFPGKTVILGGLQLWALCVIYACMISVTRDDSICHGVSDITMSIYIIG